jgi:hypothetical protein
VTQLKQFDKACPCGIELSPTLFEFLTDFKVEDAIILNTGLLIALDDNRNEDS